MSSITIYTDGAYTSLQNCGGIGVVFVKDGHKIGSISKTLQPSTNNKMEIAAVIIALKNVLKNGWKDVTIVTDSQYVIGCATKGWNRKKNVRLWYRYDLLKQELDKQNVKIKFEWVRGHDGNKFNELADELAVTASKSLYLKL